MNEKYWLLLFINLIGVKAQSTSEKEEITTRLSAQKNIATKDQIIDETFIIIGNSSPKG